MKVYVIDKRISVEGTAWDESRYPEMAMLAQYFHGEAEHLPIEDVHVEAFGSPLAARAMSVAARKKIRDEEQLHVTVKITRIGTMVPDFFEPYFVDYIVSEKVKEALGEIEGVIYSPVEFAKLVHYKWPDLQNPKAKWVTQDPDEYYRQKWNRRKFHKALGPFYEMEVEKSLTKEVPSARELELQMLDEVYQPDETGEPTVRPFDEGRLNFHEFDSGIWQAMLQEANTRGFFNKFPMSKNDGLIITEAVMEKLDPFINKNFFRIREFILKG